MDITELPVEKLVGIKYECSCGRTHEVEIENVKIGSGVINEIADIIGVYKRCKILVVADVNTYAAVGEKVYNILKGSCSVNKYVFPDKHLVADERAIGRLIVEVENDTGLIITVGSGTLNDITRYVSSKTHIPYMIVGTAPSMDGYASVVSPLIVDGVKMTYNAVYPKAIIADIDILRNAPENMLYAGFGDIIGKYTALCDWRLAEILNGECYCEKIANLVENSVEKTVNSANALKIRDMNGVKASVEALILSGMCIGMAGTSRPASGEEHHISHTIEMAWMDRGIPVKWLHGNTVGVGTGIILELYKYLLNIDIDEIYNSKKYLAFNKQKWTDNLKYVFGKGAQRVISLKEDMILSDEQRRQENFQNIRAKWGKIIKLSKGAESPENVRSMLKNLGAPYHPLTLGIDRDFFIKCIIAAKDIRRRYGVLQLLEDIGMLEEAVHAVAKIYYEDMQ